MNCRVESLIKENTTTYTSYPKVAKEFNKLELENDKLKEENEKLKHEIETLRNFGNKDCTAMADSYLAKEVEK